MGLSVLNKEKEELISSLIKIESGIARLYNKLSTKSNFSGAIQKFWRSMALEEELHADILDEIREKIKEDKIPVSINLKIENLKEFVSKVNARLKEISTGDITDSGAYSLGAAIEIELDESGFTRRIETTDQKINTLLRRIENDTKKHRVMLVNYSRGIR